MVVTILTREQAIIPQKHEPFYPTVINNANITFSNKEPALLEKEKNDN
jgi:hypothetical protein